MNEILLDRELNKVRYNKHPKRQNNIKVAAMYAMYRTGKSLEEVGKVYKISRQATYDVFRSRKYPLRSKELRGLQIIDGIKFTKMKGGYLRGSLNKRRILLQYYVWEKEKGKVPDGYVIRFIDGNKENNILENLELVAKKDMPKIFNPLCHNQFTKLKAGD